MSVDDSGLESLKKSAEEETPGSKAEYRIKTRVVSSALPSGAATESTLVQVRDAVDGLEGFTDGLEGLITTANSILTSINSNVDGLEGYTDSLESLITTSNSLLTTIRDNADEIEGFTDGLESLITSTNALLTTIRDNADQIEGFTDEIETKLDTGNALLTTIRDNADQLEGYLDGVEASLSSIDGKMTPSTSTLTNVSASASSVTLIASNASRKGFRLYNDSTQACFVCYGATASSTSFTLRLASNDFHVEERYTGIVTGIWNVAVGTMRTTELT